MWVCSAMNSESKPRSSSAPARGPGAMPSSVTNVEMPNFILLLNHTGGRAGVPPRVASRQADGLADRSYARDRTPGFPRASYVRPDLSSRFRFRTSLAYPGLVADV